MNEREVIAYARWRASEQGDESDAATMIVLARMLLLCAKGVSLGFMQIPTEPSAGPRRPQPEPVS